MASSDLILLDTLLQNWRQLLSLWSQSGMLGRAARQALLLEGEPERLRQLVAEWSAGDFSLLPPVVLLPAGAMPGAAGAYALTTRTIYLNQDWLEGASTEQAVAVLTEELGHHLDGLLNAADTPGDEGELFAALLLTVGSDSREQRQVLLVEEDQGMVLVVGEELKVEHAAQVVSTPILVSSGPASSTGYTGNDWAFAALKSDGSVVTWGHSESGGDSSGVDFDGPSNSLKVSQIISNWRAFVALRSDGSVVSWGDSRYGGDSSGVDFDGPSNSLKVSQIFSVGGGFAAVRSDGSIATWGNKSDGDYSFGVGFDGPANTLKVSQILYSGAAFAALRSDGSVVTWGDPGSGGNSTSVASKLRSGVKQICSSYGAFAALKSDGSVVTWGSPGNGGDSSSVDINGPRNNLAVIEIIPGGSGFYALRSDGSVISWGKVSVSNDWYLSKNTMTEGENLRLKALAFASYSAAGVQSDGTLVVASGMKYPDIDINGPLDNLVINELYACNFGFAAIRNDNSIITWRRGGEVTTIDGVVLGSNRHKVQQVVTSLGSFAALLANGSVVTWGDWWDGGDSSGVDFDGAKNDLQVTKLFSNSGGFSALRSDGSVVYWGQYAFGGGTIDSLPGNPESAITHIFTNSESFAGLRRDGSVVTWGHWSYGGDSSGVASQLTNVVAFANLDGGTLNSGAAAFSISGDRVLGGNLFATKSRVDPDGNGLFTYSWQTSSDGNTWANVGSNRANYRISSSDSGKQLRLVVTYRDGKGILETVTTAAGTVAYTPSHEILEILAKDSIYEPTHGFGASILGQFGSPYTIDWILNGAAGLYALGLTAANAAPVLVLRGTTPTDVLDIWDDINPDGIGHGQFTKNIADIRNWLLTRSANIPPVIVGHSLGGALAQWIAADATRNLNIRLGEIVTFNSPGIAPLLNFNGFEIGARAFKKEMAGPVTHYITSPDSVSLGGLKYIDGSATLVDYNASRLYLLGPHLDPVLVGELPTARSILPPFPKLRSADDRTFSALGINALNSPGFSYLSDYDFVERRLAISGIALGLLATGNVPLGTLIFGLNAALVSRASTESFRQSLGSIPASLLSALRFALDVPSIIAEVASERVQEGITSLKRGGAAALAAAKAYTSETWQQIAGLTASQWQKTQNWTSNAWRESVEWTSGTWQTITGAVFDFSKPFITTAAKQLFVLPASVPMLRMAAASQEPSEDSDPLSGAGLFSMAAFSAPARSQSIDVPIALSQPSTEVITLTFATVDGTAIAGVDYLSRSGSLRFEPGETEKIVTIELLTPESLPAEKDFKVRISNLQNAQVLTSDDITVVFKPNVAPVVALPPEDQFAPIEEPLFFALPPDTFSDGNSADGDVLQYTALLADGSPLPSWLSFDPTALTFSGTPPATAVGKLRIQVSATDTTNGNASTSFQLNVVAYDGPAGFRISGTPAAGNTLTASATTPDPDGNGSGGFSYSWQASSDGSTWSPVGSNSPTYQITAADQSRQLRLQISYTDAEAFAESLTLPYGKLQELPATAGGRRLTVSDPLSPTLQITSQGSPDLVELQAAVSATLHARTSSTWSSGFVAYNAGSPSAPGTGERISITGLRRYSFVAAAISQATTAIVLEPDQNSAYFLHDTYSAFFSGLGLQPDSYGRASAQRLLNIDTITMGSAGGTSIVDLTSPDYLTGPMTVFGAARGTSIVWGSAADDSYISAGSDAVLYGGLGRNSYTLGSGRETLQYRQLSGGSAATDQIRGFDPSKDRLQLWSATNQQPSTPTLTNTLSSSRLAWGGHSIEFLDQPNLSLADLTILQATAI